MKFGYQITKFLIYIGARDEVLVFLLLVLLPTLVALITFSLLHLQRLLCSSLLHLLIHFYTDLLRPICVDAKDKVLGWAVRLVDPVLDGGFARAAAAVEPVGRGSRVAKEEQAEKRPSERDEEEVDARCKNKT